MGIKRNFIFSTVLTVSNYIFPFIVYPYVARVLGVSNIGICNYVDNIVNYAMMLSMMGLSILGVREIAKAKGDRRQLDEAFTALMVICTAFTLLSTAILVTVTYTVADLFPYRRLLLIGILKLWSNFFLIDWLYRGLEDFRYITTRTILVKTAYVLSVFVLVRTKSQYVTYYLLMCLMYTANAVFNTARAMRIVSLRFSMPAVKRIFWPFCVLGIYLFLNSLYIYFNVLYLGFTCGDTEVGYYTTATKTFQLILAVYTAYSGVIMPRASVLLLEDRKDEFKVLIGKSMDALIMFAVPAIIFTMVFSRGIIDTIAGAGYEGAIVPMAIVMPLIFIIGYEQILVVQVLTPMGNDRIILFNSIVGASVGVAGNLLLVSEYASVGAAVVWVAAEVAVLVSAQYFVTTRTGIRFPAAALVRNVLAYVPCALICLGIVAFLQVTAIVAMVIGAIVCALYFIGIQKFVLHSPVFDQLFSKALKIRI